MKYYKIIDGTTFIGVVTSGNFVAINPRTKWLLTSNESLGQFVSFENKLYRDYWMQPIPNCEQSYIRADIIEISEEEYNTLKVAVETNEQIIIEEDDEPIVTEVEEEIPDITVEYVKSAKLKEMSATCRSIIEAGFDLELRGEVHHFSLDIQDQLNLISLSVMAQTQSLIPYHADGEACIFYTNEEINEIVESATAFKIYHTTYYNALKGYINSLNTIEAIAAIEYETPIPEEYKSDVLKALEV